MDDQKHTTIIEVHGIKMEVDLRSAKRIDTLRVGDRVKCLVKTYSGMNTYPGVVVGFEPFPSLPSIVVAYLDPGYGSELLKFQTFNAETKDFEIIADIDNNSLEVSKESVLARMDREIEKAKLNVEELESKRNFFISNFGAYFADSKVSSK